MSQPIPQGFALKQKVVELETAILARHPSMPILLKTIWELLKEQPENVTLMTPEERGVIVSGLKSQTQTEFAQSVIKDKNIKGLASRIAKLGIDAFG